MRRFSALAFKILNDPFVGNLTFFRVYSGVLNSGDTVMQRGQGQERAHRSLAADACKRAQRDQGSSRRRHRRRGWIERCDHGRHAVRSRPSSSSSKRWIFQSPSFPWRSSRGQRLTRKRWAWRCSASRRKILRSALSSDPESGQTIIAGHGRAASGNHRRSHEARVQGRCERR